MINFENTAPVKLKGVGGGFWVTLDPSVPKELLIAEMDKLFKKLSHLAVNASVVIDMGDAKGHEDLFSLIKSRLIEKYEVGRVSTSPQKPSVPTQRIRQRDLSRGWNQHRSNVLMLRGRVRSGQKVDTARHVVIFGDVNPGAEIVAGGISLFWESCQAKYMPETRKMRQPSSLPFPLNPPVSKSAPSQRPAPMKPVNLCRSLPV
jgi:septum site-determining protein MinC